MAVTVDIVGMEEVTEGIKSCGKNMAKGAVRSLNDLARRGVKTIVGKAGSTVYNIGSGDFKKSASYNYDQTSTSSVCGVEVPGYTIIYAGSELSFARPKGGLRFGLTPRTPSHSGRMMVTDRGAFAPGSGGKSHGHPMYRPRKRTVMWQPKRTGGKRTLSSSFGGEPVFIGSHGSVQPFARLGAKAYPIGIVKSGLSVPQMVADGEVSAIYGPQIHAKLVKGVWRYM